MIKFISTTVDVKILPGKLNTAYFEDRVCLYVSYTSCLNDQQQLTNRNMHWEI